MSPRYSDYTINVIESAICGLKHANDQPDVVAAIKLDRLSATDLGDLIDHLDGLVAFMKEATDEESIIERYDRLADEFYRGTGMMAPGKDVASDGYAGGTLQERHDRWTSWLKDHT